MLTALAIGMALGVHDGPRLVERPSLQSQGPSYCRFGGPTHPRWLHAIGALATAETRGWMIHSPQAGEVWIDTEEIIVGSRERGIVFTRDAGQVWRLDTVSGSARPLTVPMPAADAGRANGVAVSWNVERGRRHLNVTDFDGDATATIHLDHRSATAAIGWSYDEDAPVLIVASEHGRAVDQPYHQADVYSLTGDHLGEVRSDDLETVWRPYHRDGAVLAIVRTGEWHCPAWVGADGTSLAVSGCDEDQKEVWLDGRGEVAATQPHHLRDDALAGAEHGWAVAGLHQTAAADIYGWRSERLLENGRPPAMMQSLDGNLQGARRDICERDRASLLGREITATSPDGLDVHGFLHLPEGVPKALVVTLHGGPYHAEYRDESFAAHLLLDAGYAVLDTNVRGSVGFGRTYLEAGFGLTLDAQADDAETLAATALDLLSAPSNLPMILMGVSWGGMPATRAATRENSPFDAVVFAAATCRSPVVPGSGPLYDSAMPLSAAVPASMRLVMHYGSEIGADDDLCGSGLNPRLPVLAIVPEEDERIPYGTINELKDANPDSDWMVWALPGARHNLPEYIQRPMFSERLDELLESLR